MNKKVLVLFGALVLVIAVAALLYPRLSASYVAGQTAESEQNAQSGQEDAQATEEQLDAAPDFTVEDAEGASVRLSDFQGTPVVVNFWATWCPYCVEELPAFQAAYEEYGAELGFMMLDIADGSRETKDDALAYVAENGFSFPVYFDTEYSASTAYSARSLPMTLFITSKGELFDMKIGALSEEVLNRKISNLLNAEAE